MRFCSKCGDFYADRLLAFCLADGTPLVSVEPNSDIWDEATRVIGRKQNALIKQQRNFKWRRATLRAMLMATMVVSVAAVTRSISVTVDRARGELCIGTFNDLNGDGVQQASEPTLSGFRFQVSGAGAATTFTTDSNGGCEDFPAGTYTVVETPKPGWSATTPATQTVTVTAGQAANVVFGGRQDAGLCIGKFDDLNRNRVQDAGETGLSGFVFQVRGTGLAITLTTGVVGSVCSDLPVGTYTVVETPKPGWVATTPTTQTVTVTAGQAANLLFGSRREEGKLCIQAFDDLNGNRVQDAGEQGLPGFVFEISGAGPDRTLTTGQNGGCEDLPVGAYTVVEQPHSGWIATPPTTRTLTVTAGQSAKLAFGNRRERGDVLIQAFNDLNGNGMREPNEPGLSGFVFQVLGTNPATTLTTDPNGVGKAVPPVGAYTVVETQKPGWLATTPTKQNVTVTAGPAARLLFGSRQEEGRLCIRAFKDLKGKRVQDAGEHDLPGFVFQVSGTGIATKLTAGEVEVCLPLPVGAYTVVEQLQKGWIATTATTLTVTVTAGQATKLAFGNRQETGDLFIQHFNDLNGNGTQEPNEPGLPGFVFQVRGADFSTTLRANPNGVGRKVLPVGTYTVVAQPDKGWTATTPATQTVTVTAGPAARMLFGSQQQGGKLCITAFNDLNRNGKQDEGEPRLAGFRFEVRGTGIATKLTTVADGDVCLPLPVGLYRVVETQRRGWTPTTEMSSSVTVTAKQANLSFGNTENEKSDPVCSDGEKRIVEQIVFNEFGESWGIGSKGGGAKPPVTRNNPAGVKNGEVSPVKPPFQTDFFDNCTRAIVTVRYVVQVPGGAPAKKEQRYECVKTRGDEKTRGVWKCR